VVSSCWFQQEEIDELDVEIITNHASHVVLNMWLIGRRKIRQQQCLSSSSNHFVLPWVPISLKYFYWNHNFDANFATIMPIVFIVISMIRNTLLLKTHCGMHLTQYHSIPLLWNNINMQAQAIDQEPLPSYCFLDKAYVHGKVYFKG
jgi:hypothetical protein